MSDLNPVRLLPTFTSTEKPRPLTIHFTEDDSLDLTGFVLSVTMEDPLGAELTFTGTIDWVDELLGIATLQFERADLTLAAGVDFEVRTTQVWADDPANTLATVHLLTPIRKAIGTPPV